MKKAILAVLFASISLSIHAQTIKLENYTHSMRFCPNGETYLSFSARDVFNNKLTGEFVFLLYVNGSLNTTIKVHAGSTRYNDTSNPLPPVELTNLNLDTDTNKRVNFYVG